MLAAVVSNRTKAPNKSRSEQNSFLANGRESQPHGGFVQVGYSDIATRRKASFRLLVHLVVTRMIQLGPPQPPLICDSVDVAPNGLDLVLECIQARVMLS